MSQDYNPKIYVMHLREIVYTILFVILTIVLIIAMISMFTSGGDASESSANIEPTTYIYDYN